MTHNRRMRVRGLLLVTAASLAAAAAGTATRAALAGAPCRAKPGFVYCHGVTSIRYAGKHVLLAPTRCNLDTATYHVLDLEYNNPPTPSNRRLLVLAAQVTGPSATRGQARLSFDLGGKGATDEVFATVNVKLAAGHRRGSFAGTVSPGHKPVTGTFTCK